MVKKDIVIKTFEQFQQENSQYSPVVFEYLNNINNGIQNTRQVENWILEGDVICEPSTEGEESNLIQRTLICNNQNEGIDIDIKWSCEININNMTPDTDVTPGVTDYETNITIDEIIYYTESGKNEYQMVVDSEMEKISLSILDKLMKIK